MRRVHLMRTLAITLSVASLGFLTACGEKAETVAETTVATAEQSLDSSNADVKAVTTIKTSETDLPADQIGDEEMLSAVIDASEIPYPVYPNGSKYRVGGENGMKIVLFETVDSFEEVDEFYKGQTFEDGMPRLVAMNDYVRYSSSEEDKDPWATFRPGIVIHKFKDDAERSAIGADQTARTNIIMSF